MFLSKDDLKLAFGIDLDIASHYVDRPVPRDNLYWKGRQLYVNTMPGYIFMPVYTDLLRRCGLDKAQLLAGPFIMLAESIMHSAAKQESEKRPMSEHLEECLDLARAASVNPYFLAEISAYFHGQPSVSGLKLGTPFRSLNRADAYLASLCALRFEPEQAPALLEAWYALITFYLITDDLADIRDDLKNKEDNAVLEAGLNEEGIRVIEQMIAGSMDLLERVNPVLANRFDHKLHHTDIRSIIRSFSQG